MNLLYGVRILAVDYFVLSQYTRLTDQRTQTDVDIRRLWVCIRSRTVKMRYDA